VFHVKHFDVVVIGAGHAGVEAAAAAARLGAEVGLVTLNCGDLGVMSCNPAIGGLGKGHLVREVDAMDGIIGVAADFAGIQFRLLNRRKGPAVQGPRTQADRKLFAQSVQTLIAVEENIEVIEGEAETITGSSGKWVVHLADTSAINCRTIVLATGTFLNGKIHIGDQSHDGGRMGDRPSRPLADWLNSLGLKLKRLKTGTPPRLDGQTINYEGLALQSADDDPSLFSFLSYRPNQKQIACAITHTNEQTHDIVRANLERSAMYGGQIDGIGPRYCPSIEDKIVRFADKQSHQIFLEPEGLNDPTVYPNGISTSLPAEVQLAYVRSIKGLECVKITQPGYAIEYDYVDPRQLDRTLQLSNTPGVWLAGQINGTTGYEEAAAQGLVAGLNAALYSLDRGAITFSRTDSYIGVMIDDLTTRGVTEPYRMFTSRAEYRLALRADNADQRLTPIGIQYGCVRDRRWETFKRKLDVLSKARSDLEGLTATPTELAKCGVSVKLDGRHRSAFDLLSQSDIDNAGLTTVFPEIALIDRLTLEQLKKDALYASYLERQEASVIALRRDEGRHIPAEFDYDLVAGLSNEQREKFKSFRPKTLAQAGRIEGITPAATMLLLANLQKHERREA
jgi:tRNA uridine 5-carboxymethylaminomethyl modification enzyme